MLSDLSHPKHEFREYSDKMASYIYGPSFLKSIWDGSFKKDSVFEFAVTFVINNWHEVMSTFFDFF